MLAQLEESDLVLGSRYVPGGGVEDWGLIRRGVSRCGSWVARAMLRLPYRDLTGGFKAWRRETLERIDMSGVRSNGYCFQIEMTFRAHQHGARIRRCPSSSNRRLGTSNARADRLGGYLRLWQLRSERD